MTDAALLRAFTDELVLAGVTQAVICPGSRSTPLALALRTTPGLTCRVLLDERAAGFFALGMARTLGRPVVLLATSGTATVEFGPAVVEAQLSRVPLVVLTADRPPELRDRGAAQTIDQDHLFGRAAKWFAELPLFDGAIVTAAHVRSVAGRAVAVAAAGPAGPVQVNVPFREPLLPDGSLRTPRATEGLAPEPAAGGDDAAEGDPQAAEAGAGVSDRRVLAVEPPFVARIRGRLHLDVTTIEHLAGRLAGARRGLILAGPDDDPALPAALARLAAATGFPIVADPLSQVRTGPHDRSMVVVRGDQLARPGPWLDAHLPDLVLRTGAMPTSAPFINLLARVRPELLVLDGDDGWREAVILPATFVHADPAATATALAHALRAREEGGGAAAVVPGWADAWLAADRAADVAMSAWLAETAARGEAFEGAAWPVLAEALPDGSTLWAGNSMPVRDMDAWLPSTPKMIHVRSSRGANGIDGVVSTALGSAAVAAGPVALVVGDVSFLHDLNALVAARLHPISATIVLVNNDGGGIFSFLSQASADTPGSGLPEHYEELFGTPHGVDVGPIVAALGGEHRLVTPADLGAAVSASIGRPGVRVLEVRTQRARNVQLHRELVAAVQRAIAPGGGA